MKKILFSTLALFSVVLFLSQGQNATTLNHLMVGTNGVVTHTNSPIIFDTPVTLKALVTATNGITGRSNKLAVVNGTTGQSVDIYNSRTSDTQYARLSIGDTGSGLFDLWSNSAVESVKAVRIIIGAVEVLRFETTPFIHIYGRTALLPSSLQTLAAGNALSANATKLRVAGSGGAVISTAAPTIADGVGDGQIIYIMGTSDTNTWTIQDQDTLASSNVQLGATSRTLGKGDILVLMYDSTDSLWYEVSFSNI